MPATRGTVLTLGHSTHPIEAFVALLQSHGATAVADVRAAPYSRFNPQFNRGAAGGQPCRTWDRIRLPRLGAGRALGGSRLLR